MNENSFYLYLRSNEFNETTSQEHIRNLIHLTNWITSTHRTAIERLTYIELLEYVQYLRGNGLSVGTINNRLNTIRKYYEHLKEEGIIERNPAKRIIVKNDTQKVVKDALSSQELESLYQSYQSFITSSTRAHFSGVRDIAIVGLILFQGIVKRELEKMQIEHINLNKGIIYVPKTSKSNGRELALHNVQVLSIHKYLEVLPVSQVKLFNCTMTNKLPQLSSELKALNSTVQNLQHIRASIILSWLKKHDKRQVQYMIGHKWISSTENYEVQDIDGLSDLLKMYHPFG
jgi:site-specific recombinase XerD